MTAKYNLPERSTPEMLSLSHSCAVSFGNRFLVVGYYYQHNTNGFYAAVYEHIDNDLSCEGPVKLISVSPCRFKDDGHALKWAMEQ